MISIGRHADSQQVSLPYQALEIRQICGAGEILDAPGGRVVARPAEGERVEIRDVVFGDDGRPYYQLRLPTAEDRYIATDNAPHFCMRLQSDATPFAAPPNSCHLIAASRRTIDEVNAFAKDYAGFLPTMSAYRSKNEWYAISLGLISTADAPALLENAPNIPRDAYCADGANYVAVLDFQDGRFAEAVPVAAEEDDLAVVNKEACLQGDGLACRRFANDVSEQEDQREDDWFEMQRFWLLGCMQGDAESCVAPVIELSTASLDHTLRTAWEPNEPEYSGLSLELLRIGCDAGLTESCAGLGRFASVEKPQEPGLFLTAFQGGIAACADLDEYACRDLFQRFEHRNHRQYQEVLGHPPSAQLRYFTAGLWARGCSAVPRDGASSDCGPVFASYAAFLAAPPDDEGTNPERRAVALDFLRKGCDSSNADACVYYSKLAGFVADVDRNRAAGKALTACQLDDKHNPICQNIETALGGETPKVQELRSEEYRKLAQICQTDSSMTGVTACSDAATYYWRKISATELTELEGMLQNACNSKRITGCEQLAFIYSPYSATGEDLNFTGLNMPEKRLAVLRTGCMAGEVGRPNCADLAEMLEERGEYNEAQATYRMACGTVRGSGELVPYERGTEACFDGALVALRKLKDYAAAQEGFELACDRGNPYACKHLALMARDGLGREKDADEAFALFHQSCYPTDTTYRGDGEGCLFYGNALLANRDRAMRQPDSGVYILSPRAFESTDEAAQQLAQEVAHAFATGCQSKWTASCGAHEKLISEWADGAFPQGEIGCQIIDASGAILSDKICRTFSFTDIGQDEYGEADLASGTLYIWPDKDRTLVQYHDATWSLNGGSTYRTFFGDTAVCMTNPQTGRSFCTDRDPESE